MIYINYYFRSSYLPKYMLPLADLMESVKYCVFVNKVDFNIFVAQLQSKLKECVKNNSEAHIDDGNSQIAVYLKQTDYSILRLGYHPVCGFLQYTETSGFEKVQNILSLNEEKGERK